MTTYNTGNPVPSADARDRYDNSQTLDEVVNGDSESYSSRTGKQVISLGGMNSRFNNAQDARESAFNLSQEEKQEAFQSFLDGSGWSSIGAYGAGVVITSHTQTVDYLGQPYSLKPSIPASLDAPYVTTGAWATEGVNFKLVGDNSLRQDLSSPEGASKVHTIQIGVGAESRPSQDKMNDSVSVLDYAGVDRTGLTKSTGVKAAHDYALSIGATLEFEPGTYYFDGWDDTSNLPVSWVAKGDVTLRIAATSLHFSSVPTSLTLSGTSLRDQLAVNVVSSAGVNAGSIVFLSANENVETVRNESIKRWTGLAKTVSAGVITLDEPLFFDFSASDTASAITVFNSPRKAKLSGFKFVSTIGIVGTRCVTFTGIKDCHGYLEGCKFSNEYVGSIDTSHDGYLVQASVNCKAFGVSFDGVRYGAMHLTTRDVVDDGITVKNSRHGTYSAYWSNRSVYKNIVGVGNTATADSHNALQTTIEKLVTSGDLEISNNRSYGGICRNWKVTMATCPPSWVGGLIVSNQAWVAAYFDRYANFYDVEISDVEFVFSDGSTAGDGLGLTVNGGRDVLISSLKFGSSPVGMSLSGARPNSCRRADVQKSNISISPSFSNQRIRAPLSQRSIVSGDAAFDATYAGSVFNITPYPGVSSGSASRSAISRSGEIPLKGNQAITTSFIVPIKVFDNLGPFSSGLATAVSINEIKFRVMYSAASGDRYDVIRNAILTWKHKFSGTPTLNFAAMEAGAGSSGQPGDGLTVAVSGTPAIDGVSANGLFNNVGVRFDLLVTLPVAGDCRIFYEYQGWEFDV